MGGWVAAMTPRRYFFAFPQHPRFNLATNNTTFFIRHSARPLTRRIGRQPPAHARAQASARRGLG